MDRADRPRALSDVMGCRGQVTVVGGRADLPLYAESRLRELDLRWSRFRPDSEVTRLAFASGYPLEVSADTQALVRHLVAAWRATAGVFDPTLLPALVAAGYGSSVADSRRVTQLPATAAPRQCLDDVVIDEAAGTVLLPPGVSLDSGGLGKGLAADLVVGELLAAGADGAMVEIGGDLRVSGHSPSGHGWHVDVDDPDGGVALARLRLRDGGVATSSTLRRSWTTTVGTVHHLLDPVTTRSTATDVIAATVVTGTAAWSETFTKMPVILGSEFGLVALEDRGIAGLLLLRDRSVVATTEWASVTT